MEIVSKADLLVGRGFEDVSLLMGSGVYALCQGELVVYIGKASILVTRIYDHKLNLTRKQMGKSLMLNGPNEVKVVPFNKVLVWPCSKQEMGVLEERLILEFNPRFNIHHRPVQGVKSLQESGITLESLGLKAKVSERRF